MSLRMEHDPGSRHAAGMYVPAAPHRHGDGHALLSPVLVLNASYEPINVCAARRALVLVLKGVAMTEEENGHFLHSARAAMRLPSVIRLLEYRRIPHLVACCHPCNRRKGNQFPGEAGMKLMREPRAFNLHTSRHIMRLMGRSDDKWRKYLFY